MGRALLFLSCWIFLLGWVHKCGSAAAAAVPGRSKFLAEKIVARAAVVEINTSNTIWRVSEGFLCATLDWWPAEKCDYGTCSWKDASLLTMARNSSSQPPKFWFFLAALYPLTLRLGGSLQDRMFYKVGRSAQRPCSNFVKQQNSIFGFSEGCLNMSRWLELNSLFQRTGASVAFGLNALNGRQRVSKGVYSGSWDSTNAEDFIKFTHDSKIAIAAWELGNELSANGVGTTINSRQYATDVKSLREIIDGIYGDQIDRPMVVAPDGFFVAAWYQQLLQSTGPRVLDAVTRHIYNLGAGVDRHLIQKILSPTYLSQEAGAFKQMRDTVSRYGPWAQAWIGEAGGAYNSGQHLVNDAFVSSFWYLDQLGMAASHSTAVYCRQSLVGGNYALLRTNSYNPNPDYYSALLWKQVMGNDVLPATVVSETYLRAYAHCAKSNSGGLAVLVINMSNSTVYSVSLKLSGFAKSSKGSSRTPRLEYHLSAPLTDLQSQSIHLNGKLLDVTPDGNIPVLKPISVDSKQPITIAPLSIAFVVLPDAKLQACTIVE
ncbi:hypothetical protein SELMODRAFT_133100 [Selaginella moellendorffii]|uniref:Beta-glucuronidase C-terminal domain-containing protein n=1 Tax=Selaginella moellendorffii TaxID=88036 RepID=D8T6G0_SELML|nr:hypothetical protein SELMODRAFT_133100 [Selaginella moellendorffii]